MDIYICAINIGWAIFRTESMTGIKNLFSILINVGNNDFILFIRENYVLINYLPYLVLALIFSTPLINKIYNKLSNKNKIYNFIFDTMILGIFILNVSFIISSNYNPFIYFRF